MRNAIAVIGMLVLVLGLASCASSTKSEGCCPMGTTSSKAMKCEKKEHSGGCCSKGQAEGKPAAGHQH